MLTEPRVVLDYLQLLVIPRSISTGLFNENYPVSTNWLQPITTIPALLIVIVLLVSSIRVRRSHTALSAAILFFLAGHLLESGPLPLELYYEHRDYLPAMLLFWPFSRYLGHGENGRVGAYGHLPAYSRDFRYDHLSAIQTMGKS